MPECSHKDRSTLRLTCEPEEKLESKDDPNAVIRRQKQPNNGNRLSMVSTDSDRKSTVSSDSVEVLGSTSPDSETSPSKVRNSGSYESSVEILSSSSVEILNSEDPSR